MDDGGRVSAHRISCRGKVRVPRPPEEAIRLFTAEGERHWAPGWSPRYPDPDPIDVTAPGTVWRTERDEGTVTWIVADRRAAGFTYALVIGEVAAGTVTVECTPADGGAIATVTYDLTVLAPEGIPLVAEIAETYEDRMRTWSDLLAKVPEAAPGDVTVATAGEHGGGPPSG